MMDINKLRSLALDGDLAAMQAIIIHLERVEKERDDLRVAALRMERQVPIAYMPLVTVAQLESGGSGVVWCPHDRSVSDVPVYALPGAKGEEK